MSRSYARRRSASRKVARSCWCGSHHNGCGYLHASRPRCDAVTMSRRSVHRRRGHVSAVWMRLRAEARSRWRAWLGLALIIGLAGGAATAAAAGARRTETAYPRFVQAQNGYDLFIRGFPESNPERALARIAALPEVAQWARIDIVAGSASLPSGRP